MKLLTQSNSRENDALCPSFHLCISSSVHATQWPHITSDRPGSLPVRLQVSLHFLPWKYCRSRQTSPSLPYSPCIYYMTKSSKVSLSMALLAFWIKEMLKSWCVDYSSEDNALRFTASFLSSSVPLCNQLRCINCVYCIELESLC